MVARGAWAGWVGVKKRCGEGAGGPIIGVGEGVVGGELKVRGAFNRFVVAVLSLLPRLVASGRRAMDAVSYRQ